MKKSSEVLGLKVMGIKEGKDKGIVQDIVVDAAEKRVGYLIVKDSRGYGFYGLAYGDVLGIGANFVTTSSIDNVKKLYENREYLEAAETGFYVLGASVLTDSGDIVGEAVDFGFSVKTGQIETLIADNGAAFPAGKIAALAGSTVFVSEAVQAQPAAVAAEKPAPPKISELEVESVKFLTGKTVSSRVESIDGQFSIEEGTLLTEDILEEAAAHDALLMLTLNV